MSGNLTPPPLPPKFSSGQKVASVEPVVDTPVTAPVGPAFVTPAVPPVVPVDTPPALKQPTAPVVENGVRAPFRPERLFEPFPAQAAPLFPGAGENKVQVDTDGEQVTVEENPTETTVQEPTFDELVQGPAVVEEPAVKKARVKKEKAPKDDKGSKKFGTTTWVLLGSLLVVAGGSGVYFYLSGF